MYFKKGRKQGGKKEGKERKKGRRERSRTEEREGERRQGGQEQICIVHILGTILLASMSFVLLILSFLESLLLISASSYTLFSLMKAWCGELSI